MEQLALAQQIEILQAQQNQLAATHQQYVNMGMLPQGQLQNFQMPQGQMGTSPGNQFQFPGQMAGQQHLAVPMNAPQQGGQQSHRRNQSALPNVSSMAPPPAPSSQGMLSPPVPSKPSHLNARTAQGRENVAPRGRGGGAAGGGHARRHSLALPEAKKAAELAEQKRKTNAFQFPAAGAPAAESSGGAEGTSPSATTAQPATGSFQSTRGRGGHGRSQSMAVGRGGGRGFQFPPPQATNDGGQAQGGSDFVRRGSHGRTGSRNFDGNWRQPNNNNNQQAQSQDQPQGSMGNFSMGNAAAPPFQPGHRARGSVNQSINSIGNFQYGGQPQLMGFGPNGQMMLQPGMAGIQGLNPMQFAQLQALQQMNGMGLQGSQPTKPDVTPLLVSGGQNLFWGQGRDIERHGRPCGLKGRGGAVIGHGAEAANLKDACSRKGGRHDGIHQGGHAPEGTRCTCASKAQVRWAS